MGCQSIYLIVNYSLFFQSFLENCLKFGTKNSCMLSGLSLYCACHPRTCLPLPQMLHPGTCHGGREKVLGILQSLIRRILPVWNWRYLPALASEYILICSNFRLTFILFCGTTVPINAWIQSGVLRNTFLHIFHSKPVLSDQSLFLGQNLSNNPSSQSMNHQPFWKVM